MLSLSHGEIVPGDAVIADAGGGEVWLTLAQTCPLTQGVFVVSITYLGGGSYGFGCIGLAEEYALFTTLPGVVFTASFAQTNTAFVSNDGEVPIFDILSFAPGETRYLAYWDDRDFDGEPDSGDNYGWVMLWWSTVELHLVASATCVGGGIVVGTDLIVPAPAELQVDHASGLTVSGTVDGAYAVQHTSSLLSNDWQSLTNIALTHSPYAVPDPDATNVPVRFYRAVGEVNTNGW